MNSVELFKYVVATIGAVVAVILIVVVSGAIYGGDDPAPAMEPEMAQAEAPPPVPEPAPEPAAEPAPEPAAEPAPEPEPAPAAEPGPAGGGGDLVALLAAGDAAAGAAVVVKCRSCHTLDEGGARRVGPNIWNMVGAPKGVSEGYAYSEALSAAGGTWTYAELDGFLANPREYLPGTKMTFAGIADATERANLILHLRSLSNDPLPLPAE